MKRIAILGSTGSIGRQCLRVVDSLPGMFEVVPLAAEQAKRYGPKLVSVATEKAAAELCGALKSQREREKASLRQPLPEILFGAEGIERVATYPDAETV